MMKVWKTMNTQKSWSSLSLSLQSWFSQSHECKPGFLKVSYSITEARKLGPQAIFMNSLNQKTGFKKLHGHFLLCRLPDQKQGQNCKLSVQVHYKRIKSADLKIPQKIWTNQKNPSVEVHYTVFEKHQKCLIIIFTLKNNEHKKNVSDGTLLQIFVSIFEKKSLLLCISISSS